MIVSETLPDPATTPPARSGGEGGSRLHGDRGSTNLIYGIQTIGLYPWIPEGIQTPEGGSAERLGAALPLRPAAAGYVRLRPATIDWCLANHPSIKTRLPTITPFVRCCTWQVRTSAVSRRSLGVVRRSCVFPTSHGAPPCHLPRFGLSPVSPEWSCKRPVPNAPPESEKRNRPKALHPPPFPVARPSAR